MLTCFSTKSQFFYIDYQCSMYEVIQPLKIEH
jgi:hypothetical protein